jgi:hypothetical protein
VLLGEELMPKPPIDTCTAVDTGCRTCVRLACTVPRPLSATKVQACKCNNAADNSACSGASTRFSGQVVAGSFAELAGTARAAVCFLVEKLTSRSTDSFASPSQPVTGAFTVANLWALGLISEMTSRERMQTLTRCQSSSQSQHAHSTR